MVWTRDRLMDRQRVVHWDLVRSSPKYSAERVLDMSPGARLRVYNGFNKGRISIPDSAFNDGNFSLVINSETLCPGAHCSGFVIQADLILNASISQMSSRRTEESTRVICTITTARFSSPFRSSSMSPSQVRLGNQAASYMNQLYVRPLKVHLYILPLHKNEVKIMHVETLLS